MRTSLTTLLLALLCLCLLWQLLKPRHSPADESATSGIPPIPDTVYVPKPYPLPEIQPRKAEKPEAVRVYEPDTAARKRLEHDTLLAGVELQGRVLTVARMDTTGRVFQSMYALPRHPQSVEVDHGGRVKIKKKKRILLKAAGVAVTAAAVILAVKAKH